MFSPFEVGGWLSAQTAQCRSCEKLVFESLSVPSLFELFFKAHVNNVIIVDSPMT